MKKQQKMEKQLGIDKLKLEKAQKELEEERMRGLHHESNCTEAGNGRGGSGETTSAAASSLSSQSDHLELGAPQRESRRF